MDISSKDIERIEIALADVLRTNDELSQIIARQDKDIEVLKRRVQLLLEREAEREANGVEIGADQRPPHW